MASEADSTSTKKKDEAEETAAIKLDGRGEWFEPRVVDALKLKSEKWKKMAFLSENV